MKFRIREARERMGMNQAQLASKLGITISTLSGYETGKHDPKSDTLALIAQICDTSTDYLLGRTDNPARYSELSKSLPESALRIARTYSSLDSHGKRIVDFIIEAEADRCNEDHKQQRKALESLNNRPLPRLISLQVYDDPAAAGAPLDATSASTRIDFPEEVVPPDADYGVRISGDSMEPTIPDGCIAFVRKAQTAHNRDIVIAWVESEGGMVCKRAICDGDRLLRLESANVMYLDITGNQLNDLRIYGIVVGHTEA